MVLTIPATPPFPSMSYSILMLDPYGDLLPASASIPKTPGSYALIGPGGFTGTLNGATPITLGALLFANDISTFPSISTKSVRVIKYIGKDKKKSEEEMEGKRGYAVGFSGMLKFIMGRVSCAPAEPVRRVLDRIEAVSPGDERRNWTVTDGSNPEDRVKT